MSRVGTAFRAFFRCLSDGQVAEQVAGVLDHPAAPAEKLAATALPTPAAAKPEPVKAAPAPSQNPAITLLAALQRDARFVDFLQEDLSGFSDAEVGAVARDVHRDSRSVVQRMFAPAVVDTTGEGTRVTVAKQDGRYRFTGNVTGHPPFTGTLQHSGWQATKTDLPQWTGTPESTLVIAPAEVEL